MTTSPGPLPIDAVTVAVVGWIPDRARLEEVLNGWEEAMDAPESLSWLAARLRDEAVPKAPPAADAEATSSCTLLRGPCRSSSSPCSACSSIGAIALSLATAPPLAQQQLQRAGEDHHGGTEFRPRHHRLGQRPTGVVGPEHRNRQGPRRCTWCTRLPTLCRRPSWARAARARR